jgi:hypothetical protein
MAPSFITPPSLTRRILYVSWALAALVSLFFIENIWIDPRVTARHHRVPSLIPAPDSDLWMIVFALGGLFCIALVVVLIIAVVNRGLPRRTKIAAGAVLAAASLFWLQWSLATNGGNTHSFGELFRLERPHSVLLKWQPSTSKVSGYNIYRRTVRGVYEGRLNSSLLRDPSYTDSTVQSGFTYFYVTRAVDAQGRESFNSNEISVSVP